MFTQQSCSLGPLGQVWDNVMGGNPNPTPGQLYGSVAGYGYGSFRPLYGYQYVR
jgi:hypothetical protein